MISAPEMMATVEVFLIKLGTLIVNTTQMSILDLLDGENPYTYSELLSKTPEIHLSRRDANDEFVTLRVNFALMLFNNFFCNGQA